VDALSALMREIERLNAENAALKRRLEEAQARPAAAPGEVPRWAHAASLLNAQLMKENSALKKQLAAARAANPGVGPAEEAAAGRLARENNQLKEALAKAELKLAADPGEVGKLVRQLKAARTRVQNLTVEVRHAWAERDEARNVSPNITSKDLPILIKVFHPDAEHGASPTRKKQLTAGMQIINRIKDGLERAERAKKKRR